MSRELELQRMEEDAKKRFEHSIMEAAFLGALWIKWEAGLVQFDKADLLKIAEIYPVMAERAKRSES